MCQKAHVNGVQKTYLDIAKGAVETFLKYRQRSQDCMGDRYMLLTFEDPPSNVKAGWKENHATFMNELKNLQSNGLTSMGEALKNAFDLLNLNRMQSGIDTYGQGRCPFYLEPSVIIVITDGGKYSFRNGVHQEITLPLNAQIPGTKLTKEPFRWDQRLFSLVLRMAGNKMDERVEGKVPHDDSPIEKMCEVTGGRSYRVKTQYVLNQCIESLVQKVQPGVVVHFDALVTKELKDGEVQDLVFQNTKKMIYVHKNPLQKTFPMGFWPIPEPYWPDAKMSTLPPRDAHPKIRIVTPCIDEPQIVRNFPVDKYELEASPLTLQILSKKESNKIWPLLASNVGQYDSNRMHGGEMSFGYLKSNTSATVVHLYVLPYNYQMLLPLINELLYKYNVNPPSDWIYKFGLYIKSIPQYYCPFLRRSLAQMSIPFQLLQYILPETMDGYLNTNVANHLKHLKNVAKQDQENLCLRVFKQLKMAKPPYHQVETVKLNCGLQLKRELVTHPMLKDTFGKMHSEINTFENYTIVVPTVMNIQSTKNYRNPFDIPRRDLVDEIARMRDNFFKTPTSHINLYTKDAGHSLPIAEMGNYQEYLKNKETPLRELEPTNVRQHMFGNPYKKDKHMVMVDEADVSELPILSKSPNMNKKEITRLSRKRKAGPIRKDFVFKRAKFDFGFPASPGLPGLSEDEDTSASETSSAISDDDDNRLVVDFDESTSDEFSDSRINGHVRDFLNGETEEEVLVLPTNTINSISPIINLINPINPNNQMINPINPIIQPVLSAPVPSHYSLLHNSLTNVQPNHYNNPSPLIFPPTSLNLPINTGNSLSSPHLLNVPLNGVSVGVAPQVPVVNAPLQAATSPTSPTAAVPIPAPSVPLSSLLMNDMNDPHEISKILQQSFNGGHNNFGMNNSETSQITQNEITNHNISNNGNNINNTNNIANGSDSEDENHYNQHIHTNGLDTKSTKAKSEDFNEPSSLEEMDDDLKENIKQQNIETRSIVFKDIRRLGRDYSHLISHLCLIKGNYETKFDFVRMCIDESLRFRRKHMANCIQEWWDKQMECLREN